VAPTAGIAALGRHLAGEGAGAAPLRASRGPYPYSLASAAPCRLVARSPLLAALSACRRPCRGLAVADHPLSSLPSLGKHSKNA
ncbi:hypothetical protein GW17_00036848, partial [Ensete ventricosum]